MKSRNAVYQKILLRDFCICLKQPENNEIYESMVFKT